MGFDYKLLEGVSTPQLWNRVFRLWSIVAIAPSTATERSIWRDSVSECFQCLLELKMRGTQLELFDSGH